MFYFVMETQTLMSVLVHYFHALVLVLLVSSGSGPCGLLVKSLDVDELPHARIFSSLFKAMSEHGKTNWIADLKENVLLKPDHRYIRYMRDVHKKLSRERRSLNGGDNNLINTIRLIKPRGECLDPSKEVLMEDVFYNLDQLRDQEQVLKSILLLSFDRHQEAPVSTVCYLKVKEKQKDLNQCTLCPGFHTTNFTVSGNGRLRGIWVEVDISPFLLPLLRFQRRNLHLLIKLSCAGDRGNVGDKNESPIEPALWSPSLLLYLNDPSKQAHQWSPGPVKAAQRLGTSVNRFGREVGFNPKRKVGGSRRRRESPKGKRGEQSLETQLPALRPSSEFKTSDCDLYDFRVRFSQLKLDHWIVFPPKYNPRYCRGQCPSPMGSIYGSPVHTMVQNIIFEKLDSSVPRPSCVPSHYRPLSVMIFEKDGSYVFKDLRDMVATRCTCR